MVAFLLLIVFVLISLVVLAVRWLSPPSKTPSGPEHWMVMFMILCCPPIWGMLLLVWVSERMGCKPPRSVVVDHSGDPLYQAKYGYEGVRRLQAEGKNWL